MISLTFPDHWDVETYWPKTPPPLTDEQIRTTIGSPLGQPPLHQLAKGKSSACIIVDDLSRPTPCHRVLPFIIEHLDEAGIPADQIRIVVATGTHGDQDETALRVKLGAQAMDACQVLVHDDLQNTRYVGTTSFGTRVHVDRDVLGSDLLVGVGGVYPQHSTGFGGGSKLALGVLGRKTIAALHFGHASMAGAYDIDNDFRRDVAEIARMIQLNTMYTLHIDAHHNVVNLMCGDHFSYYPQAAAFSKERFTAPVAGDADVVISNAYPLDTSFTFMRKSYKTLATAPRSAMKIMVSSNYEGIGRHGLFQHVNPPRYARFLNIYRRVRQLSFREILDRISKRIAARVKPKPKVPEKQAQRTTAKPRNTDHLWVFRTDPQHAEMPEIEGITVLEDWGDVLRLVEQRVNSKSAPKVRIYPCAPIQCIDA